MFYSLHLRSLDEQLSLVSLPTKDRVGFEDNSLSSWSLSSPTKVDTGLDWVIAGLLWNKCQTYNSAENKFNSRDPRTLLMQQALHFT